MKATDYTTSKANFRNNAKYGRITNLVEKATGKIIFSAMGICSKKDLIKTMQYQKQK